jgi:hypothetical protein
MKILVFCQRKKSYDEKYSHKVESTVNKIENFIKNNYYSDEFIFEYLTDEFNGQKLYEAEYKMLFDVFNKNYYIKNKSIDFMREHVEYYDIIILQTCPLLLVKKQLPYLFTSLKTDGIILFTNFSYYKDLNEEAEYKSNILNYKKINNSVMNCIIEEMLVKTECEFNEYKKNYKHEFIYQPN